MPINCLDGVYPFFDGDITLALPVQKVRAILEAEHCIDKARGLAELTVVQLKRLFSGSKWKHCKNLLRIAKRFHLQAHDGTHAQCKQCVVICALKKEPFNRCVSVAKHDTPEAQLQEAMLQCLFR